MRQFCVIHDDIKTTSALFSFIIYRGISHRSSSYWENGTWLMCTRKTGYCTLITSHRWCPVYYCFTKSDIIRLCYCFRTTRNNGRSSFCYGNRKATARGITRRISNGIAFCIYTEWEIPARSDTFCLDRIGSGAIISPHWNDIVNDSRTYPIQNGGYNWSRAADLRAFSIIDGNIKTTGTD